MQCTKSALPDQCTGRAACNVRRPQDSAAQWPLSQRQGISSTTVFLSHKTLPLLRIRANATPGPPDASRKVPQGHSVPSEAERASTSGARGSNGVAFASSKAGASGNGAAFAPSAPLSEERCLDREQNINESMAALKSLGRSVDSLPPDLAQAVENGRIPGEIINRLAVLEESALLNYLLRFGGFRERLLADDLFLTKVAIECGVGICTKTSAELERRRGMFFAEFDFVIADIIMAIIADFMLVWLPAPTVALSGFNQSAAQQNAIQNFLSTCPDNAFQVALRGEEFTILQRLTAVLRNGVKLFAVGTCASLFGTALTNGIIILRSSLSTWGEPEIAAATAATAAAAAVAAAAAAASSADSVEDAANTIQDTLKSFTDAAGGGGGEAMNAAADQLVEASTAAANAAVAAAAGAAAAAAVAADAVSGAGAVAPASVEVPILATSLAYGAYMALSSNLRYQVVAGVIEQRMLDPWLHDRKVALATMSFIVRTGNTFIGSLLWVDFARWVGVQ